MFPVRTQQPALCIAFPDVCLTPTAAGPIPITYPNFAISATAIPTQFRVFVQAMPAHNMLTRIPVSQGDNAGLNMNPVSGMVMGPAACLKGSVSYFVGGAPVVRMGDPCGQNGITPGALGVVASPSQVRVLSSR